MVSGGIEEFVDCSNIFPSAVETSDDAISNIFDRVLVVEKCGRLSDPGDTNSDPSNPPSTVDENTESPTAETSTASSMNILGGIASVSSLVAVLGLVIGSLY